ncbi:MAG: DinB superfamily protein [Chloroflexi bacterium ADurb.Bin325]|nr:MAG: DinB superfamily protein [Chloroflexi bacterium ADurb.Bin325]
MPQASTAAWPDVLALLRRTPRTLRDLTADVAPHILRTRPAADQWSISEVISHLCAVEPPYRARLVRITLQENPYVAAIGRITGDYDPDTPVPILIETFTSLRTSTLDFLESLTPVVRARTAVHAELGPITLRSQVEALAANDEEQLARIRAILDAVA